MKNGVCGALPETEPRRWRRGRRRAGVQETRPAPGGSGASAGRCVAGQLVRHPDAERQDQLLLTVAAAIAARNLLRVARGREVRPETANQDQVTDRVVGAQGQHFLVLGRAAPRLRHVGELQQHHRARSCSLHDLHLGVYRESTFRHRALWTIRSHSRRLVTCTGMCLARPPRSRRGYVSCADRILGGTSPVGA